MLFMGKEVNTELVGSLTIGQLAEVIQKDCREQKKPVPVAAAPYISNMVGMNTLADNIGADTGHTVVTYAMCNLSQYRGEIAKMVKAELNKRLKAARR